MNPILTFSLYVQDWDVVQLLFEEEEVKTSTLGISSAVAVMEPEVIESIKYPFESKVLTVKAEEAYVVLGLIIPEGIVKETVEEESYADVKAFLIRIWFVLEV